MNIYQGEYISEGNMKRLRLIIVIVLFSFAAVACTPSMPETHTPEEIVESRIVISEVMAGVEGNNNFEFIELHNTGDEIIDLQGWSLWYQLASDKEQVEIYAWDSPDVIPPHGHYLMGRAGQDLGIVVDAVFEQPLVVTKGGLNLKRADGSIADALGWGQVPGAFKEGGAASALQNGFSLERAPGGDEGNGEDTNDNSLDFVLNPNPRPQNSGSPVTPLDRERLSLRLEAPESVKPGEPFEYLLTVANEISMDVHNVAVRLTIPVQLEIKSTSSEVTIEDSVVSWNIESLGVGEELSVEIIVEAPLSYLTIVGRDYYLSTSEIPGVLFGEPVWTSVEGGALPVGVARGLLAEKVIIEGIATMYTGGFYAGSGAKFYLEDETGGVQVYVSGAGGKLNVPLGARVRVEGAVELYRGAVEIVPFDMEYVEIISGDAPWSPLSVSLQQAINDRETLPGRLVQVDGTATRIEEFSYSFEIDLVDDEGRLLTLYIDKLTEFNAELLDVGKRYRATGIIEVLDAIQRLNPRLQSDLSEIFPPVLQIEARAPSSIQSSEEFTVTLTAFNHTEAPLTDLHVWSPLPIGGASLEEIHDGGELIEGRVEWRVPELASGQSVSRSYILKAFKDSVQIVTEGYGASAVEWTEPIESQPLRVFVGSGVPIWAIQGSGFSSPYKLEEVTTAGVVTGVFPDLGGFWIQEIETDDDVSTSAGVFVFVGDLEVAVEIGDMVEVTGQVREVSQQTQIRIDEGADLHFLSHGNEPPEVVNLDPPVSDEESLAYYESQEGMLVQVLGSAVAVSPTSKYGEYSLVLPHHGVERLYRGDDNGMMIMVDDGMAIVHQDRSTLSYVVETGDEVSGCIGPLAYTYGQYKIEPVTEPQIITVDKPLPALEPTEEDEFSIMTWNVEDLFDIIDPHPSNPPRPRRVEYELALTKVANTILAAGVPTVVGLQEVENLGILEDLAVHDALVEYRYQSVLLDGTDSRGIDVGYLVRGDRAEIVRVEQFVAEEGLTSRPPLLVEIEVATRGEHLKLYVINNHFSSMSGGELVTEPRRVAQAAWNVMIVEGLLDEEPEAYLAVIGDLNSYLDSPPIDVLREAGLSHVFEILSEEDRYTYIFEGVSQTLDHILVTPTLWERLIRVGVLHTDADYPPPEPGDTSPERKSDHDPVVATFSLAP
jgi:predicted extracellular nuclease